MRLMSGSIFAFIVGAFLVSGCSAGSPDVRTGYELCGRSGVYRGQSGVVRLCAPITDTTVAEVRALLTEADSEILITSDGGPQDAALALAALARERNLTVRVRQFCLSSGSTYVLAMADRGVVEPYTVVAFHHTAAWLIDALAARQNMAPDVPYRQGSQDERLAYRSAGRDDRTLDRIAMAIEPICFRTRQGPAGEEAVLESRYRWYVPNAVAAREIFGDRVSGYALTDDQLAIQILRGTLGQPDASVRVDALPTGESRPEVIGPRLPACV